MHIAKLRHITFLRCENSTLYSFYNRMYIKWNSIAQVEGMTQCTGIIGYNIGHNFSIISEQNGPNWNEDRQKNEHLKIATWALLFGTDCTRIYII